jgi:hypothetical protein
MLRSSDNVAFTPHMDRNHVIALVDRASEEAGEIYALLQTESCDGPEFLEQIPENARMHTALAATSEVIDSDSIRPTTLESNQLHGATGSEFLLTSVDLDEHGIDLFNVEPGVVTHAEFLFEHVRVARRNRALSMQREG